MQTAPLLEDLRAIRIRTHALLARVPDEETFGWQPHEGRAWSVAQCLDHLNNMNQLYFGAVKGALDGARRASAPVTDPVRSSWIGNWFANSMEPGTRKLPAPKKSIPRLNRRRDEVVTEFLRGLDEIEAVLKDAATIDLNTPTFASPFFKPSRVRAGTGFRVLLAHMRRHLVQAEQVLAIRALNS